MSNYLIIGASSGIGEQLYKQLKSENHQVYATYFSHPIEDSDFHYMNVLDEELKTDYLPETLDALIYCPGTINLKPFDRLKTENFLGDFSLQVLGAIKVIQAVLPKLKKSDNGSILMFSSMAVQTGLPYHTQVSVSKGAIEGLTKALAAELAPKIRVNCIAPSLTDTPLASSLLNTDQKREANALRHPLKKVGKPQDLANLAEFLISDKAAWITGQIMHVDGGISHLRT